MLQLPVLAYIDPGTTNVIVPSLVALAGAAGVALKVYWGRIVGLLRFSKSPEPATDSGDADHEAQQAP